MQASQFTSFIKEYSIKIEEMAKWLQQSVLVGENQNPKTSRTRQEVLQL